MLVTLLFDRTKEVHRNPTPGKSKVVRVGADGSIQNVATGLSVPTAMTLGPRRSPRLGLRCSPGGLGQIVRIDLP